MKMLLIWLPIIRDIVITVFLCVLFFASIHEGGFKFPISSVEVDVNTGYGNKPIDIRVRN